eukprot:2979421-Prymnesium_polylepis.1
MICCRSSCRGLPPTPRCRKPLTSTRPWAGLQAGGRRFLHEAASGPAVARQAAMGRRWPTPQAATTPCKRASCRRAATSRSRI